MVLGYIHPLPLLTHKPWLRNFAPLDPRPHGMVWYSLPDHIARCCAGLGEHTHLGEEY